MIKIIKKFIASLSIILLFTQSVSADMDPKVKAISSMAIYGTVGGALLGAAALAFDADGRSVAVGASVGLYLGLIFGGYVIGTHYMRKKQRLNPNPTPNYYPDTQESPYEQGIEDPGFDAGVNNLNKFKIDYNESIDSPADNELNKNSYKAGQVYYVNFLNYQF